MSESQFEPETLPTEPEDPHEGHGPVTEEDAERGHAAYLAVDDLDDESNGVEA